MSRSNRRDTNERIRQEIEVFLSNLEPGEKFTINFLRDDIQEKFPKADINNSRVGQILNERDDIRRIGQRRVPGHRYESWPVFWQRLVPAEAD